MCYEPISPRAGCAGPLAGWHGHFEQRVRFRSTRLCNEPISRVQATKIAIDSSGCAPRASAGVRRASIETLGSRFGLLGRSALYEGRANESLQQMGALGGCLVYAWRANGDPCSFVAGGLAPTAEFCVSVSQELYRQPMWEGDVGELFALW
jgi:hypothetical protein